MFWEGHTGLESPKTTKEDAEDVENDVLGGGLSPPQPIRGFGEIRITSPSGIWGRAPAATLMIFGHCICNFVRFHARFSAFWNLTVKANKTDPIRPLLPATGLEGARASCAPVWIRPCCCLPQASYLSNLGFVTSVRLTAATCSFRRQARPSASEVSPSRLQSSGTHFHQTSAHRTTVADSSDLS